jgi:intein-encoded DNA endonuclease-like protein
MKSQISLEYILGFISGDGSFYVSISKENKIKVGFTISQHVRDKDFLEKIKEFFGVGRVVPESFARRDSVWRYEVTSFKELIERILPIFKENSSLITSKDHDLKIL